MGVVNKLWNLVRHKIVTLAHVKKSKSGVTVLDRDLLIESCIYDFLRDSVFYVSVVW